MKMIDFEKIVFRISVLTVGAIFILLAPTTHIFASWYPGKKDILWIVPACVIGVLSILWLMVRLCLPLLIQKGVFEDRRKTTRSANERTPVNISRVVLSTLQLTMQLLLLLGMCVAIVAFMRGDTMDQLLTRLMSKKHWEIPEPNQDPVNRLAQEIAQRN
ncbi:MAG: hypothetical protein H6757_00515 [Candidatus Omnitrophica bacterium]|nr:hypothetical protein [Candidatus Omnitrophota bacterium]